MIHQSTQWPPGAVVLVYGDGADLAAEVVRSCFDNGILSVLVAASQVAADFPARIQSLANAPTGAQLLVRATDRNLGSAGGYRWGLAEALAAFPAVRGFVLLDDDNVLCPGSIEALVAAASEEPEGLEPRAFCAQRTGRLVSPTTKAGARSALTRGAFLGVDVPARVRSKLRRPTPSDVQDDGARQYLPWAPYGGLMMERATISLVGLPSSSFFMYADDLEFTARVVRRGGWIRLVSDAAVADLRPPALQIGTAASFASRILDNPDRDRVMLWIKNEAARHVLLVGRSPRLALNVSTAMLWLGACSAVHPRRWRVVLGVAHACATGLLGSRRGGPSRAGPNRCA